MRCTTLASEQWRPLNELASSEALLAAAAVVCGSRSELSELPHVALCISDFADSSCELWTLDSVSNPKLEEDSAVRLLDRLLKREWTGLNETFRIARCRYNVTHVGDDKPLLLDWWLTKYLPLTDASFELILKYAIEYRRISVLEWIAEKRVLPLPWDVTLRCDQAESAYWLNKRGYMLSMYVVTEIEKNNLEFLEWLYDNEEGHQVYGVAQSLPNAVEQNNVEMLQYLFDTYLDTEWEEPFSLKYIKRDLKTIKWLEENLNWAPQEEINEEEENDDLDWEDPRCLHKQWIDNSIFFAAQDGQLENIKYLYDHPLNDPACEVIFAAAEKGNIEVVKWLHERQPGCAKTAISFAVKSGKLELVKWLHDQLNNSKQQNTNSTPHKKVLKHVHEAMAAIDLAAAFGFFEVIQWLHTPSGGMYDLRDGYQRRMAVWRS